MVMKINLAKEKVKPSAVAERLVNLFQLNRISGAKFDRANGEWTIIAVTGILDDENKHMLRLIRGSGKSIRSGHSVVTAQDTLKYLLGKELRRAENTCMWVK